MKDILIILPPAPFEINDFKNALNVIEKELKSSMLYLHCSSESLSYYKNNYPQYNINPIHEGIELTKETLNQVYKKSYELDQYVLVVLKNIDHQQSYEYDINSDINIYRWQVLNNRICSIKNEITEEEDIEINSNIFSKMHKEQKSLFGLLPYGFTVRHPGYGYVNEMGFRVPNDYQKLKNRDKNHKLICFFGGSCCYSMRVRDDEMFTAVLEKKLNKYSQNNNSNIKYTVLNFGMMGYVVLNEMITYLLYAQELNPEYVVGFHFFNDVQSGIVNDNLLLRKFNTSYNHGYEEKIKTIHQSDIQIKWKEKTIIPNKFNLENDIILSYSKRDQQFSDIVTSDGSQYISVIQAFSFSKKELSEREKIGYNFYSRENLDQENAYIKRIYEEYISFLKKENKYDKTLDLHTKFSAYDENETIFCDSAHTVANGDRIIANHLIEFFLKKGLL